MFSMSLCPLAITCEHGLELCTSASGNITINLLPLPSLLSSLHMSCRSWLTVSHPLNTNPFPGQYVDSVVSLKLKPVTMGNLTYIYIGNKFLTDASHAVSPLSFSCRAHAKFFSCRHQVQVDYPSSRFASYLFLREICTGREEAMNQHKAAAPCGRCCQSLPIVIVSDILMSKSGSGSWCASAFAGCQSEHTPGNLAAYRGILIWYIDHDLGSQQMTACLLSLLCCA